MTGIGPQTDPSTKTQKLCRGLWIELPKHHADPVKSVGKVQDQKTAKNPVNVRYLILKSHTWHYGSSLPHPQHKIQKALSQQQCEQRSTTIVTHRHSLRSAERREAAAVTPLTSPSQSPLGACTLNCGLLDSSYLQVNLPT